VLTSTRTVTAGATVTAIAPLLQGSALTASASPEQESGRGRAMTFHVVFSPLNYTDLGGPGPSAADVIVFHQQLQQGGKTVGEEVGCILVDPDEGTGQLHRRRMPGGAEHHRLLLRGRPATAQGSGRNRRRFGAVPDPSPERNA
jgi:hypothetical protein